MLLVCLICRKELIYEQSDITPLVRHLNQEHPRINLSKTNQSQQTHKPQKEQQKSFVKENLQKLKKNSSELQKLIDKSVQTELKLDWSKYFKETKKMENKKNVQESKSSSSEEKQRSRLSQEKTKKGS